jgi:hypothetical protein
VAPGPFTTLLLSLIRPSSLAGTCPPAAAAHTVADLDRRLGQIDTAIEEAAKRGRTNTAPSGIEGQRKARASLVDERNREAGTLLCQLSRQSAAAWPPRADKSRPTLRPSATWPSYEPCQQPCSGASCYKRSRKHKPAAASAK